MNKTIACKTVFKSQIISEEHAASLYNFLKYNISWDEGVRSKKGFTRKAKALNIGDIYEIDEAIILALSNLTNTSYNILGIYLNYYEDGEMWTPNHSHKGTHQLVLSLGVKRILQVGKKNYEMKNGDAILFGSSIHGVPKNPEVKTGRISIATFMIPI